MARPWKVVALAVIVLAAVASVLLASKDTIKEPAVAGAFYPAEKDELAVTVNGYLSRAGGPAGEGRLIALIAPHAGYQYSGQVAAHTYRHISERPVDTVILVGASHFSSYAGASVLAEGRMNTPLGSVKINGKIAKALLNDKAGVTVFREAYEKEHSLEVQLPFLQQTLRNFTVVPLLMGAATRESFTHLVDTLTGILKKNGRAIIIASTDLSHYHDSGTAANMDRKVIDAVARMSVEDLQGLLAGGEGEACGGYPVLLTMMVARNLGATNGILYKYADSGDVTGDRSRVVGYGAMGIYRSPLSERQKGELLSLARTTVVEYVKNKMAPDRATSDPRLQANGATFVTINRRGSLRGCIGNIQPVMPLDRSVIQNAVSASSRDFRFPPMTPDELADMEVEVTVLSPLEPLTDIGDVTIGTHGLYIVKDGHAGILLPQVATEYGWDRKTFLEQVCVKAGLPKDAWKDAQLYRFSADILK